MKAHPQAISKERSLAHGRGLELLKSGEYARALETLQQSLERFGPHVGLLADLAGAAYLQADIGRFVLAVERLESEFRESKGLLSRKSQLLTHIALAKYFEELGRIHEAFLNVEKAMELADAGDVQTLRVRCQTLRLLASFGKENELGSAYRQCLAASESFPQIRIECQQALLLAEVRLFGFSQARTRLSALLYEEGLQAADLRLSVIDLLEIAIERRDFTAIADLSNFVEVQKLSDLDPYEKAILTLARDGAFAINQNNLFHWSQTVTPYAYLRLLALTVVIAPDKSQAQELRRRFLFQIQSYDHLTQKILFKKWPSLGAQDHESKIDVWRAEQRICFDGRSLSFKASPLSWTLLNCIADGERDPLAILKKLAKHQDSAENLESVRIALLRLNKKLAAFIGLDWTLKFRKEGVVVNSGLRFELC